MKRDENKERRKSGKERRRSGCQRAAPMMPVVLLFTCHPTFPTAFPRGFGNHSKIRGAEAHLALPAEWTPREHQSTLLFLAHAATDLMLRAIKLVLLIFWKAAHEL